FVLDGVDIIPQSDSGERDQNSEPSIAVAPVNPMQMVAGSFGGPLTIPSGSELFFKSSDGGATWSNFDTFLKGEDKSIAWSADGSAVLVANLVTGTIVTNSVDGSSLKEIEDYAGSNKNDQPWIRTGPSNHVYVAFNDDGRAAGSGSTGNGGTASVLVSTDGGTDYKPVVVDRVGTNFKDDPAVRLAVNGDRVYAVFNRWINLVEDSANGKRFESQLVVVRSDDGGADEFKALGFDTVTEQAGNGVTAADHVDALALGQNTSLTLGQERAGGGLAIAVDPNNADHV